MYPPPILPEDRSGVNCIDSYHKSFTNDTKVSTGFPSVCYVTKVLGLTDVERQWHALKLQPLAVLDVISDFGMKHTAGDKRCKNVSVTRHGILINRETMTFLTMLTIHFLLR